MKSKTHAWVLVAGLSLAGLAGSASWLAFGARNTSAQPQDVAPDYALAANVGSAAAVEKVSGHAEVPAFAPVAELPGGLELWVAAVEYGPQGKASDRMLNTVVLDYYQGAGPHDISSLLSYRGLRLQLVFHSSPGFQPPASAVILAETDNASAIFYTHAEVAGMATDSYLVNGPRNGVEVRIWNTATGQIPATREMEPLLSSLSEWLGSR